MVGLRVSVFLLAGALLGLLTVPGCAGRFDKMVRARAADDFSCSSADLKVDEQQRQLFRGTYEVSGCEKSDVYHTFCNLFGICRTESSGEVAARRARADQYAADKARYDREHPPTPPPDNDASSSSPSPSSPSSPSSSSSSSSSSDSSSSKPANNCNFDSDCGSGRKCNSGRCSDTGGSKCGFDSDCGGNGAKCNSGKCSNAPDGKCNFDSECPGGKCSSGKCKF